MPDRLLEARIPPPVYALITAALAWWLTHRWPVLRMLPAQLLPAGWALIAAGVSIDALAVVTFRRHRTTVNPLRPGMASAVVAHGIYAYSRNPMYLGLLVALSGWVWLLGSPPLLLLVAGLARLLVSVQIVPEEAALQGKFGVEYERYCRRVHRWFGRRP